MRKTSKNLNNFYDDNYGPDYNEDINYDYNYDDSDIRTYNKRRRGQKRRRIKLWLITLGIIAIIIDFIILLYTGKIWFNSPTRKEYPIQGITVSSLHGEVNFNALEFGNISFAYLKATEGESFVDEQFKTSWESSKDSTVKTGAYHKFSFSDDGTNQAENFIKTVGKISSDGYRLYPAVEITKSGLSLAYSPKKETVVNELKKFCKAVNDEYGVNPIIITGDKFYKDYLQNDFSGYKLWIIDLFSKPSSISWSFWCYSPRGKLNGISKTNNYIDLSAFKGSKQDFIKLQYR